MDRIYVTVTLLTPEGVLPGRMSSGIHSQLWGEVSYGTNWAGVNLSDNMALPGQVSDHSGREAIHPPRLPVVTTMRVGYKK